MPEPIRTARLTLVPASPARRAGFDAACGTRTLADRLDAFTEAQMAQLFDDLPLLSKLEALDRAANDAEHILCFLLTADGTEIGYAAFLSFPSPAPEAQIALLPAYRGRGYAKEAFDALLPTVFAQGAEELVWRALPDAEESIALARSLGAEEIPPQDPLEAALFRSFRIAPQN